MRTACIWLVLATGLDLGCGRAGIGSHAVWAAAVANGNVGCRGPARTADCLNAGQPAFEVRVPDASSIAWARLSEDGRLLVATIGEEAADSADKFSVAAFDPLTHRELWRTSLSAGGHAAPGDGFFLPAGVVLALPQSADTPSGVIVLDRQTGAKKWQRFSQSHGVFRTLAVDEENDFLLTSEGNSVDVLDGATGTLLASVDVSPGEEAGAPRVYFTPSTAYVVASGIARIARRDRRLTWQQRFATYAYNPPAPAKAQFTAEEGVALAGLAILSAVDFAATGSGLFPVPRPPRTNASEPDYQIGLTTPPSEGSGLLCIGSLGIVSCFAEATGAFAWSRRFPVSQFRSVSTRAESVCALAGGFYVHRRGSQTEVNRASSSELYCVNRLDGSDLSGFEAPFNPHHLGVPLTKAALENYDSRTAWRDAASAAAEVPARGPDRTPPNALVAIESGLLVAQGPNVLLLAMPSGRTASTTDLHEIGSVQQLASTRDTVVASATRGFAGFDTSTGALRWKARFPTGRLDPIDFSSHDPARLVRVSALPAREADSADADKRDAGMYWLLPEVRTLIAAGVLGGLAGLSLENGAVRWQLKPGGRVTIDGPAARPCLIDVGDSWIRVYELTEAEAINAPP